MNIDERIHKLLEPHVSWDASGDIGPFGGHYISDVGALPPLIKQLIRDVLEEVKPERLDLMQLLKGAKETHVDQIHQMVTTRNELVGEMEAKIKELGL